MSIGKPTPIVTWNIPMNILQSKHPLKKRAIKGSSCFPCIGVLQPIDIPTILNNHKNQ